MTLAATVPRAGRTASATWSGRRPALWLVAAAVVVAAAGSYAALSREDGRGSTAAGALPPVEPDTGLVHVHGLGVDPADGGLYAATHSGVFRVPEHGRAERIANRAQDTMGFAVTGPRTFIGSGHPDHREDDVRPPLLGLIESTDAGETWRRLSLHGEADFHALRAAHGRVYGYDSTSGTFMVSADRLRWDRRSQLPMRDFAVDPADPDHVVATTQQGLVRSADGGRSWRPVATAPTLVVPAWTAAGGLYGVGVDGTVHTAATPTSRWAERGSAGGPPEAMAVDSRPGVTAVYVAVAGRGILVSRDGGRRFAVRYAEDQGH